MASKWASARMATLMPTKNMNRALRFYTKVLGGKLLYRGEGEMKDYWAAVRVAGEEFWLVLNPKPEKRKLAYQTFLVKDIRGAVKELQKKGIRFPKGEKGTPTSRIEGPLTIEPFGISAFFQDSEGNLLMVWQNNPPM